MMLGKQDKLNPRKYADKFLEGIANGRVIMFDAGHAVHDQQSEQFRKTYLAHLRQKR
jgi:hypothetical protein